VIEKVKISSADLRPKIVLAFVPVALLVGATGVVGYYSVGTVDDQAHHIADDGYKMDATSEMIFAVETQQEAILHAQLGHTEMAEGMFAEGDEHFEENGISAFESSEVSTAERQQLSSISELHDEYDAVAAEFFEATAAGNTDLAAQKATEAEAITEIETQIDEIVHAVGEAESGVQEISTATDDQAASSEEVVAMVDEVASVSEQTATEASSVSAATEQQTSSLSAVGDTADQLSKLSDASTAERLSALSETLREEVAAFELESTAAETSAATPTVNATASGQQPATATTDGGHDSSTGGTDGRTRTANDLQ